MDSILFMLKANKMKPRCDIVLYAKSLFILNWLNPTIVPIINYKKELINKLLVQENLLWYIHLPV